jgi:hypothetical protein
MKNLTLTLMGMTALAMGCKDKDCADTAGGCDTGAGMEEASFNIAWTDDGSTLEVSVSNPHVDGYFLGLAETGSGANGWYGEDCEGDTSICHDMGSSNSLSLSSVHPDVGGGGLDDVVAGSTTLMHVGLWAGVTYAFFSNEGDGDYANVAHSGGDDTSYYE